MSDRPVGRAEERFVEPVVPAEALQVPIDVSRLLQPLSDGSAGVDVRRNSDPNSRYQRARVCRSEARAVERHADFTSFAYLTTKIKDAYTVFDAWNDVKELSIACLREEAKDFQIAAWLTEALVRLHGLPGLAAGADLMAGLLDRYWHDGFPAEDRDAPPDEAFSARAMPLEAMLNRPTFGSLDGTVVQPLRAVPLFRLSDGYRVSLSDWHAAERGLELGNAEMRHRRRTHGLHDITILRQAALADVPTRRVVLAQVDMALPAWEAMGSKIDACFGWTIDMRAVSEILQRIKGLCDYP